MRDNAENRAPVSDEAPRKKPSESDPEPEVLQNQSVRSLDLSGEGVLMLHDHAQTRDETIQKAQEIFGPENEDLFESFKVLLSKHGLS